MPPPPQAVSGVSSMKGTELGSDLVLFADTFNFHVTFSIPGKKLTQLWKLVNNLWQAIRYSKIISWTLQSKKLHYTYYYYYCTTTGSHH